MTGSSKTFLCEEGTSKLDFIFQRQTVILFSRVNKLICNNFKLPSASHLERGRGHIPQTLSTSHLSKHLQFLCICAKKD